MDKTVSIVRCGSYNECREGIDAALNLIGGMEKFVHKGDKVVIKPNLVSKKRPDSSVTTNPDFLHAVICAVEAAGGIVTIAESPGGPYNRTMLNAVYHSCGVTKAIEGTNASLNYDTGFTEVEHPAGHTIKKMPIINPILEADVIISLPKLKTHAMTSYTGAVKNLFGTIPGTYKAEMHFRLDDRQAFCSMLVDLCECVKPTLSIMDAVIGMEGDGPTSGKDRFIGLILASANPYALDLAASSVIDYKPEEVDTVRIAAERGHAPTAADELDIRGESIESIRITDFIKPQSHFNLLKLINLPPALNAMLVNKLASKPEIKYDNCIRCGECARCCPPHAISMDSGRPVIDKTKCIRCFCCQELCPKSAVAIKRPLLNKFMIKFLK
ncbi:MAG: DUF362 domain-containing protein [Clostridiales bacterium]|nr:DUF362 domain-containing protein [Clostridiales bacterium]